MAAIDPVIRLVVCDAGPLIHLDELGCLDLLADFREVWVPPTVWKEVERHRPTALSASSVQVRRMESNQPDSEAVAALCRTLTLHQGEIEAIQLALYAQADLLLTDDTAARLAAESLTLPVRGTIGVIVRAIRRQHRSAPQVIQVLESIPALSTLHIKRSFLEQIIQQVRSQTSSKKP